MGIKMALNLDNKGVKDIYGEKGDILSIKGERKSFTNLKN
jgi:hypothetical protein